MVKKAEFRAELFVPHFLSSYTAKFVIEKERMYVENASRAMGGGFITVDNLEPNPKNPIIAAFFSKYWLCRPAWLRSSQSV